MTNVFPFHLLFMRGFEMYQTFLDFRPELILPHFQPISLSQKLIPRIEINVKLFYWSSYIMDT